MTCTPWLSLWHRDPWHSVKCIEACCDAEPEYAEHCAEALIQYHHATLPLQRSISCIHMSRFMDALLWRSRDLFSASRVGHVFTTCFISRQRLDNATVG